jgi:integrase
MDSKREPTTLTPEEVRLVIQATATPWRRDLVAVALGTGMRKGELLGFRKMSVHLERRTITVAHSYDRDSTKGGHTDTIPFPEWLTPYLKHAIAAAPYSALVFPAPGGGTRFENTDAVEIIQSAEITGANVHDKWLVAQTLDAVVVRAPRGPRWPLNLCLDKGYDYADAEAAVRARGITPHIRRRGEKPLLGWVQGKPRRWVVERTNAWHNRFRGLLVRWERIGAHYLALLHLACALIAFRQAM